MKIVAKVRIDKYLWSIRVYKTRSLASSACEDGKVRWNENLVKASKNVNVGELYEIKTKDRKWVIKVTQLIDNRVAFSEAELCYQDLTPEEDKRIEKSQVSSFYTGKRLSKVGRPTKRDRRDLDDLLGQD